MRLVKALVAVLGVLAVSVMALPTGGNDGTSSIPDRSEKLKIEQPLDVYYPVIELGRFFRGDEFEVWLQVAPRLARHYTVLLNEVDTLDPKGGDTEPEECTLHARRARNAVIEHLQQADTIRVKVLGRAWNDAWSSSVMVDGQRLSQWIRENGWNAESDRAPDLCDLP